MYIYISCLCSIPAYLHHHYTQTVHIGKPAREDSAFSKLTWQSVAETEPRQIEQLSASQRISVVRRLKLGICRRSNHVTFPRMTSPDVISYHTKLLYRISLFN